MQRIKWDALKLERKREDELKNQELGNRDKNELKKKEKGGTAQQKK